MAEWPTHGQVTPADFPTRSRPRRRRMAQVANALVATNGDRKAVVASGLISDAGIKKYFRGQDFIDALQRVAPPLVAKALSNCNSLMDSEDEGIRLQASKLTLQTFVNNDRITQARKPLEVKDYQAAVELDPFSESEPEEEKEEDLV